MKQLQDYTESELFSLAATISSAEDTTKCVTFDILKTVLIHEKDYDGSFLTAQHILSSLTNGQVPNVLDYVELCNRLAYLSESFRYLCLSNALMQLSSFIKHSETYSEESSVLWSWKNADAYEWDHGTFCSKEEAIEDALLTMRDFHEEADTICLAKCKPASLPTYVEADHILEYLDKQYSSEYDYDDYLYEDVPDEHTEWLEKELSALMEKFHKRIELYSPRFTILEEEEVSLDGYERPQPINMR